MKIRKISWKRIICFLFVLTMSLTALPTSVKADVYWPEGPSISTPSAIVMEVNSGAILYEKNSDEINYPASITKIMTTMLVLEYCELDEVVTFSDDAINLNQGDTSHIARDYGEQMTVEECLYAVMLESANECAYAVAEHVGVKLGGDYQTFIDLMNEKAADLGCTNTHFANANGLPDNDHWTSAHDMALIAAEAYKNETFRIITGSTKYQIPPTNKHSDITYLSNHHKMLHALNTAEYVYDYCTGGKTGYTEAAGATLVTYAEKDGLTLVCVVMRTTRSAQYTDTTTLFDYCFQNFQAVNVSNDENSNSEKTVNKGVMNFYESYVALDENAYVVIPVTADVSEVETSLITKGLSGNTIAQMQYIYGTHLVGAINIVPNEDIEIDNYFELFNDENSEINIVKIKPSTIFGIVVFLVVLGVLIYIIKRVYDNFYVIIHDMHVKKQRRKRFKPVSRKKKKWKKRDRMFK